MSRTFLMFFCWCLTAGNFAAASTPAPPAHPPQETVGKLPSPPPLHIPAAKAAPKGATGSAQKRPSTATKPVRSPVVSKPAAVKPRAVKSPPVKAKAAASSVSRRKLPAVRLNLSLPPELVKDMELGKPVPEVAEVPVLPPMFGEQKAEPSPYQLSGKLITNERQKVEPDNYFDTVEGAEFSIEYRH